MTVKQLINKLQKCNPDAEVCLDVWSDPVAKEVKEYTDGEYNCIYIGDDLENITYELTEENDFREVINNAQ